MPNFLSDVVPARANGLDGTLRPLASGCWRTWRQCELCRQGRSSHAKSAPLVCRPRRSCATGRTITRFRPATASRMLWCKRRIKTQTVLPSAETAAMLFWALMASGQIAMRKIDGWWTLPTKPLDQQIDLAA